MSFDTESNIVTDSVTDSECELTSSLGEREAMSERAFEGSADEAFDVTRECSDDVSECGSEENADVEDIRDCETDSEVDEVVEVIGEELLNDEERGPVRAEAVEPDDGGLRFSSLGLSPALMQAITSSGYTTPTPIQAATIPLLLEGRDVLGQAQTGSGKTGAFAIPLLQGMNLDLRQPQVLVLVPTRELAIQVAAAFERYAAGMPSFRVLAIYGGASYQPQFQALNRGVHVVVGTPGRVMDHMNRGSLKLQNLRCLVLDEADEMLRMGFAESVEWVLTQLPQERQIALFSATMPEPIRRIAQQHLRQPAEVTIRQKTATADTIRQRYVVVAPYQKEAALARLLEVEPVDGAIIFVKLRSTTEPLAEFLNQHGHRAAALNGDVAQAQRERIIEHLKSGRLNIVVATDVAARGLDVQRISHVFNYDLPGDAEAYVHRIGRTGRAGRSGEAILFVHPRGRRVLKSLEYATRQTIEPMDLPSNRVINKQRIAKFHEQIKAMMTDPLMESMRSIMEHFRRENPDMAVEEMMAAMAVMATGGKPLLTKEEFHQVEFDEPRRRDSRDSRDGRRGGPRDRGDRFDRGGRFDRRERFERGDRGDRREHGSYRESAPDRGPARDGERTHSAPPFGESRRFSDGDQQGGGSDEFRSRRPRREEFNEHGRSARPDGPDRRPRERSDRREEGMDTYRIEVGHAHQVKPGNIVGAIANEAGIDSSRIGRIQIFDDFSTVDLPSGMPSEIFHLLRKVWVSGKQLEISREGQERSHAPERSFGKRRERPEHRNEERPRRDRGAKGPRKPRFR